MKDPKTFRQQLKEQINKFKRKLRANPKSANFPEIPSVSEENNPLMSFPIASDQLYEHIHPHGDFQSLDRVQNSFGNSNPRLLGRRLERSVSYDSLCYSASTMSELTSLPDQSLDDTLQQPVRSWDRSSMYLVDYPRRSFSLQRNYMRARASPIIPSSSAKEVKYFSANKLSKETQLTPRLWNSPTDFSSQSNASNHSGLPNAAIKRQLSFSESVPTPPQHYNKQGFSVFPHASSDRESNTLSGTAMEAYATEMVKRMLSRYNDSHSPVSTGTESSIEISRGGFRKPIPFGLVTNSPATSWSTNSHKGYRNRYYYNSPVDMYATSPTTSSLSSILPPPLNTPNPSPDGNLSTVECIVAPPVAFRDSASDTDTSPKSVDGEG